MSTKEKQELTRSRPTMWDKNQMFEVIQKMYDIPAEFDGLRRGGTAADVAVRSYLEQQLKDLGLTEVSQMHVPFAKETYTNWALTVEGETIPCYFLRGAEFTDANGVSAELVYVGESIKGHDVKGKIVVMDMISQYLDLEMLSKHSTFTLDRKESFKGANIASPNMPKNWPTEYYDAAKAGAAGLLVILPFETGTDRCYPDVSWRVYREIPGLYLGKFVGEALVAKIKGASSKMMAHLVVEGNVDENAKSANVIGFLKGETDDAIVINSHTDSSFRGAVQDASGVSVVLALASYYAQVPAYYRQKDIYFVLDANHYEWHYPQGAWDFYDKYPALKEKACLNIAIEHIGLKAEAVNGRYEPTTESEPALLFSPQNKNLLTVASMAMQKHNMDRTVIPSPLFPGYPGEGRASYMQNIPTFNYITGPDYVFLEDDRPELVDKERLEVVANVFLDIIDWAMYKPRNVLTKIDTLP